MTNVTQIHATEEVLSTHRYGELVHEYSLHAHRIRRTRGDKACGPWADQSKPAFLIGDRTIYCALSDFDLQRLPADDHDRAHGIFHLRTRLCTGMSEACLSCGRPVHAILVQNPNFPGNFYFEPGACRRCANR
jgi:hypothetical protein